MERRDDLGGKLGFYILTAVISILLGMFFNSVYGMAREASLLSNSNKVDIAVLQKSFASVESTLCDLNRKMDAVVAHVNREAGRDAKQASDPRT